MGDEDVPHGRILAALRQRGPVHHLHVHREAGGLQVLGGDQRHLVVELVLLAGQDADLLVGDVGAVQQLLAAAVSALL